MNQTIYKDEEKNAIRVSKITKIEGEMPFTGLGIKYVASGEETYYANEKKFTVKEGEYIIGNDFTSSIVEINQKQPVQGLCIDISTEIISEVALYYDINGSDLKEFLLSDQFFVNRYDVKNTSLGYSLIEINNKIKNLNYHNDFLRCELFYSLAESIITDQRYIFDHLSKLGFKKVITNEELFRAMLSAKAFIDDHVMENPSLDQISLQAGLSKYHFIRVFKNAFGISPYQYQKRKRLELAKIDLINGNELSYTAIRFGFPDAYSFSKAFKQQFGKTPGSIRKSNF
jgi:AraC family transcriptional regulator